MILHSETEVATWVAEYLKVGTPIAVDVETDGKRLYADHRICGFGMGYRHSDGEIRTCYISVRHDEWVKKRSIFGTVDSVSNLDPSKVFSIVKLILENPLYVKLAHNAKFEIQAFRAESVEILNIVDTMVLSYLDNPEISNALKTRLQKYFNTDITPLHNVKKWFRAHKQKSGAIDKYGYKYIPLEVISPYTEILDCKGCVELYEFLVPRVAAFSNISKIEHDLIPVIADMEWFGMPICEKTLDSISSQVATWTQEALDWMFEEVGFEFDPTPNNIADILYKKLGIDLPEYVDSGLTQASTLQKLNHPAAQAVLAWRGLDKVRSTYLEPLKNYIVNGRIHAEFLQLKSWGGDDDEFDSYKGGTDTGRLASQKPNLQNISKPRSFNINGKVVTVNIRKAFRLPDDMLDDWQILSCDWSQVEMRILAEEAGDTALIEAFKNGEDIHAATATKVFGKKPEDLNPNHYTNDDKDKLTDEQKRELLFKKKYRQPAKAVNFGVVYGQGKRALAQSLGMELDEAEAFLDTYFAQVPGVKKFNDNAIAEAERQGYTETFDGRRRYLQKSDAYKAPNTKIQGRAADMNKIALARVYNALKNGGFKSRIINNIHDDILVLHYKPEKMVPKLIIKEMEHWPALVVPVTADMEVAHPSWGDQREFTKQEKKLYNLI